MTAELSRLTAQHLLGSADHLRVLLEAIDSGALEASGRQRAFIAGAQQTMNLVLGSANHRPVKTALEQSGR